MNTIELKDHLLDVLLSSIESGLVAWRARLRLGLVLEDDSCSLDNTKVGELIILLLDSREAPCLVLGDLGYGECCPTLLSLVLPGVRMTRGGGTVCWSMTMRNESN